MAQYIATVTYTLLYNNFTFELDFYLVKKCIIGTVKNGRHAFP